MPKPTLRRRAALAALLFAAPSAAWAATGWQHQPTPTPLPTRTAPATVEPEHIGDGICNRTPQVRQAILWRIEEVDHCAFVTDAHLAEVRGEFDLNWWKIKRLRAGDFDGLSSVTVLTLHYNRLASLEAGVFDGLSSLRRSICRSIG